MNKDVKKLLAEHRDEILPDHRVKEKVKRDLGISSVREGRLAYAHGGERAFTSGKKAAVAVVAVLLIAALFLGVFLPLWLSGGGVPPTGQTDPNDPVHPGDGVFGTITDADSFYAYGAASVGSILASAAGGAVDTAAVTASETAPLTAARDAAALTASADEAQVAIVGKYLSLVESLLSDGGIKSTPVEPGMGCEFGMKVESADLIGGTSGYILYYDKIFLGSEVDEGEREDNYSIEGYLVTESATYPSRATIRPRRRAKTASMRARASSSSAPIRTRGCAPTSKSRRSMRRKAKTARRRTRANMSTPSTTRASSSSA